MQANVGLKALRKPLQHAVHVDTICVRPGVLQTLSNEQYNIPSMVRFGGWPHDACLEVLTHGHTPL